jgi:BMFP domain-containing protein YqiC
MFSPKNIQDIVHKVLDNIPPGLKTLPEEVKSHLRYSLTQTLENMDLVTRDEFETQRKVLIRTREKVEKLEKQLDLLEQS